MNISQEKEKKKNQHDKSDNSDDSGSIEEKIFSLIEKSDSEKIKNLITQNNLKFWEYLDNEGSTVLIKSTYADLDVAFNIVDLAKEYLNQNQLIVYINKKAFNGFTALHYASFRGNIKLIEKLIEIGGDYKAVNNNGLNVIHMAAQGDQPSSLVLFKEKYKINIQLTDNVLSGPIHWSAYMGSDISLDFLASWNLGVNNKDKDGFTPLHLAVMTDRIKIAKKLLKLSADADSLDSKNRKPINIAMQKNFKSMEQLLNEETNYIRCIYNIKQAKKNNFYPFLFLGYFISKEFFTLFTLSYYCDSNKLILLSIMSMMVLFILNCILLFNHPSIEKKKLDQNLLTLVLAGDNLKKICPWCNIKKTKSFHHCYYCNLCIEKYDHHCIWLSNCIGKTNIFTFKIFLVWILLKILLNLIICFKSNLIFFKCSQNFFYFFILFIFKGLFTNSIIENSFLKTIFPVISFLSNRKFKQIFASLDIITGVVVFIPVL